MGESSSEPRQALPVLPCPNCGENILQKGFYNGSIETRSVREHNYTQIVKDRLYVFHNTQNYELDHDVDLEPDAYCSICRKRLPWLVGEIRSLDGAFLTEVGRAIAKLLGEARDKFSDA